MIFPGSGKLDGHSVPEGLGHDCFMLTGIWRALVGDLSAVEAVAEKVVEGPPAERGRTLGIAFPEGSSLASDTLILQVAG